MSYRSYNSDPRGPPPGGPLPANKWAVAAHAAEQQNRTGTSSYAGTWENVDDAPEDYEDSAWLEAKTKKVQNDSLSSTRRALQRLNETETVGQNNLTRLNQQSEQLYNIERRLDSADHHAKVSDAKADHLKNLNRFFLLPSWGGGKAKKREEAARRHEAEEDSKREKQREADLRASANRRAYQDSIGQRDHTRSNGYGNYTTPEGLERDDTEQEIDRNLDQISSGLSRLKMMGHAMNAELEAQTPWTNRIMDKTSRTHERLDNTTKKINRIK
ncbi:Protein transport protein S9 plasma membrane t-SNARE [Rhizophlyctis rosea]|uniref:Protein transport protein S9 plasma membrane t-SNARE n=1 Tax=Rhizophlyctis rosea TaxID=64517 RepID=A0AAD5XAA1_9FUNG|nr:Protein transport protein S9 plasma membrane t-SNARE [Rhizophlyctis rosea]